MATPVKQKNGKWRVRVYDYTDASGKPHYKSITCDTKAQAEFKAGEYKLKRKGKAPVSDMTCREAVKHYIELSEILSITTLNDYKSMAECMFPSIMDIKVSKLTEDMLQTAINAELRHKSRSGGYISPKTIRNRYGLFSASLKSVCNVEFKVRLPEVQQHIKYYPEPVEVIKAINGSEIELPCLLAMWLSFTMSELRGLKYSDIQGDTLTVNRVLVSTGGEDHLKENAKVDTRIRRHRIPAYIFELIKQDERYKLFVSKKVDDFIVTMNRNRIYLRWKKIREQYGWTITFHDLRHLSASVMAYLEIPEKYAMERGGWKTPHIMKSVYQHTFQTGRVEADNKVDEYFNTILNMTQGYDFAPDKH